MREPKIITKISQLLIQPIFYPCISEIQYWILQTSNIDTLRKREKNIEQKNKIERNNIK